MKRVLKSLGIALAVTVITIIAIPVLYIAGAMLYGVLKQPVAAQKATGLGAVAGGFMEALPLMVLIFVIAFAISYRRLGRKPAARG